MKTELILARLGEHQQTILRHVARCDELVAQGPAIARAQLAGARLEMFRLIRAYQLFKHIEIFDPVIARGTHRQIAHATRLKAQCIAVGEAYRAHVNVWTTRDVAADWPTYRQAEAVIGARGRTHMVAEAEGVQRLLGAPRGPRSVAADDPLV